MVVSKKPKPKPKVVINYPPVPTKKWVPPDERPKKPRPPSYVKPKGVTQRLAISSLEKCWNRFLKIKPDVAVLNGNFSQSHKRFRPKSNGFQGPCNCTVAIAFSKMYDMKIWTASLINKSLIVGDDLYYRSIQHLEDKCIVYLQPSQVYSSFYVDEMQVTMTMAGDRFIGKILPEYEDAPCLIEIIEKFFQKYDMGIVSTQNKEVAVWTKSGAYFAYAPDDHTDDGSPWDGVRGQGYAVVMRFLNSDLLVLWMLDNLDKRNNSNFTIYPCTILRIVKIDTKPPLSLDDIEVVVKHESSDTKILKAVASRAAARDALKDSPPPIEEEIEVTELEPSVEIIFSEDRLFGEGQEEQQRETDFVMATEEYSPDVTNVIPEETSWLEGIPIEPREISESRIPIEKPRVESITYFQNVVPEKIGILRASMHQGEEKFQKYAGQQSLASAVSAIAMLRIYKSRVWFSKILDDILTVAMLVHHETVKSLRGTEKTMRLSNIIDKIVIGEKEFSPDIEEYSVVGKLQSQQNELLDLQPALEEFFREYDACVLSGPITLALWIEEGMYYMFDPNERDKNGLRIIKEIQVGSQIQVLEVTPGVACVTWYKTIKSLVQVYIQNIEKAYRRDQFTLNRVQIKDYVKPTEDWNSYHGISTGKWILRGYINQNSKIFTRETRNTQSSASACAALVISRMRHVKEWNRETVDQILMEGDTLYTDTINKLKDKGKFVDGKLMVGEVLKKFPLWNREIVLNVEDCLINGVINARKENDIFNIKKALEEFFKDNETCVVTARFISAAIWKQDGAYYYFDPHSRDCEGILNEFGVACVLRCFDLSDLASVIEANLGPSSEEIFNVSLVEVEIRDVSDDGIARPALNNYTELNPNVAILRSMYSIRSEVFDINAGKQAVPTCFIAVGMAHVLPAAQWSRDILDEIITMGDDLYIKSMIEYQNLDIEVPEEEENDDITTDNVLKQFKIGINKMEVVYGEIQEGNYEDHFMGHMMTLFSEEQNEADEENDSKPVVFMVESDLLTFILWKYQGIFYVFDPNARDDAGQVLGKDDWSAKIIELDYEEEYEDDYDYFMPGVGFMEREMGGGDATTDVAPSASEQLNEERRSAGSQTEEDDEKRQQEEERRRLEEEQRLLAEEQRRIEEELKEAERLKRLEFWKDKELSVGKACIMWFTRLEYLLMHIIENTPPNRRVNMNYKLTSIKFDNKPETKNVFDPEYGVRRDVYAGDWYEFKEIEHGRWILRATMNQTAIMFPESNRGKQSVTNCYAALANANFYSLTKFKPQTMDDILKYGDRLLSYTKALRKGEIKANKELALTEEDIETIVNNENYEVEDYVRQFCIAEHRVHVTLAMSFLKGDIHAKDMEDVLDVKRALEYFFRSSKFGLLCAKTLFVAIWRGQNVYYMFDPNARGPSGAQQAGGRACITRYLNIEPMANVFLENLPKEGKNQFLIHRIKIRAATCCRERQPEPIVEPPPPKMSSFNPLSPGKFILRGNFSQDDPKFGRGRNVQCAPVAIVALTMTLLHKSEKWTKPIIDDIVTVGDELYTSSVDTLGFEFNPWEQGMTIHLVQRDFKIGIIKANCEIRHTDQRGIIDIKHPKIYNIRQGIEKFFEENTHGVLQTEELTVALWEEEEGSKTLIYMFDPNPRGATGMPYPGGTACVLIFVNAKVAADHIISVIPEEKRGGEFVITPVEIVVGKLRTKGKGSKKRKTKKGKKDKKPKEGVMNLPRCSDLVASALAKRLRQLAEEQRKRKEAQRIAKIGREEYFAMPDGDFILRGLRSQASDKYSSNSRGNQDIPNCIASYVMHCMLPISSWTHRNIDTVLDIGEQLYIDSYITYNPHDPKLGLENVLRRFCIKNVEVQITIYKPLITDQFLHTNLVIALVNYFQQETFGIIYALNQWVSVFFKGGYYYFFDPQDRDYEGNRVPFSKGCAIVLKCQSLHNLATRIMGNLITSTEDSIGTFSLILVNIKEIKMVENDKSVFRASI